VLVGGFGVAAYQPLCFNAVSRTGVAMATFLAIGVAPVVTGLARWLLGRQRPSRRWWLATGIACGGVGFLSLGGGRLSLSVVGVLVAVAAGACYSLQATALARCRGRTVRRGRWLRSFSAER
jgi:DME family drug/metabolite transporter